MHHQVTHFLQAARTAIDSHRNDFAHAAETFLVRKAVYRFKRREKQPRNDRANATKKDVLTERSVITFSNPVLLVPEEQNARREKRNEGNCILRLS